jgi:hypothetical protein
LKPPQKVLGKKIERIKYNQKPTRFDTRNPFVDTEGLAVVSQQPTATTEFLLRILLFCLVTSIRKKKGISSSSDSLSMSPSEQVNQKKSWIYP